MVGQGKERTLQESDSVENMEESCEDSDFLELVSQGQESHPLVRFTRLAGTKKAELEYHYNPDVERNKGKDMKPLWEAAKNTVDGGIKELQEIITERRQKSEAEAETLKLEVVKRDLQILSMKFDQHLTNKQKDEKFEVFRDYSAKTSDLNLGSIKILSEKSLNARRKLVSEFYCSKDTCRSCQGSLDQQSVIFPCGLEKPQTGGILEGVITKYAFLSCVRSKDPRQRELAITTFRDLLSLADQNDEEEVKSDIQRMISIQPKQIQSIVTAFFRKNTDMEKGLFSILIDILICGLKVLMKLAYCHELESLVQGSFLYQIETNLSSKDTLVFDSIMDQDGLFGFISWCSKFLITSLSENGKYLLLAEMFIFNLEICSPLVKIFDCGSGSYPWMETLFLNFSKTLKHVWCRGLKQGERQWAELRESFVRVVSEAGQMVVSQAVVVTSKKFEVCGECRKRINKKPKIHPLCFQGSHMMETYPREIARMERPPEEWTEDVSSVQMEKRKRSVLLVCGPRCMLKAMSQMNPCLSEIVHKIIPSITNRTITAQSEDKLEEMQKYFADKIEAAIVNIKYFNLRNVVETVFPPFAVKIEGNQLDFELKHYVRKKTIITMKNNSSTPPRPRPSLPGPELSEIPSESLSDEMPGRMRDYFDNLMLHSTANTGDCSHHQVWGGWAKFHPLDNFTRYTDSLDEEGISKSCINFQLKLETCAQIDLKMMNQDGINEMMHHVQQFKERTLHLFSIHLLESQVDFLRESCHKVVVCGPSHHDQVAIDKVFSDGHVKCLLGLWDSEGSNICPGIIVCSSPKTYFAFVPQSFPAFFNFLTLEIGLKVIWPLVRALTKALVFNVPKGIQFDIPETELSLGAKRSVTESIYGLGILNIIKMKKKFNEIFLGDSGLHRFQEIHEAYHDDRTAEKLSQEDNGLVRYHSKHLLGCKHEIKWKGSLDFSRNLYRAEADPDLMMLQRTSCSGWAFQCRSCLESPSNSKEPPRVPSDYWNLMRTYMFIFLVKENLQPEPELEEEKASPTLVLELGSVNRDIIEFLKKEETTVLSFLCSDEDPRSMKYLTRFSFYNGKILGKIFSPETTTFKVIHTRIVRHSWANNASFCREFFGVIGRKSSESEGKFEIVTDESPEREKMYEKYLNYQCSPFPPVALLHSLGPVLWTGEIQTFLITSEPVKGFNKCSDLRAQAKHDIVQAVGHVEQEDTGSSRNCPFLAPSGHYVYSNYAAITGKDSTDHHFKRCGETAVSLIAFDVERKVVENIIGTFKRCFVYNLHIQDFDYLYSQLRDTKTTMLAFLLEKNELVRDVLKISPAEFAKRFFILKFEPRECVIKAYLPREKEKMLKIWRSVSKTSLMSSHEKMFKKIKKPEKVVRGATVRMENITMVTEAVSGGEGGGHHL